MPVVKLFNKSFKILFKIINLIVFFYDILAYWHRSVYCPYTVSTWLFVYIWICLHGDIVTRMCKSDMLNMTHQHEYTVRLIGLEHTFTSQLPPACSESSNISHSKGLCSNSYVSDREPLVVRICHCNSHWEFPCIIIHNLLIFMHLN